GFDSLHPLQRRFFAGFCASRLRKSQSKNKSKNARIATRGLTVAFASRPSACLGNLREKTRSTQNTNEQPPSRHSVLFPDCSHPSILPPRWGHRRTLRPTASRC